MQLTAPNKLKLRQIAPGKFWNKRKSQSSHLHRRLPHDISPFLVSNNRKVILINLATYTRDPNKPEKHDPKMLSETAGHLKPSLLSL